MSLISDTFRRSSNSIDNISKSLGLTRRSISSVNDSVENISKIISTNTKNKRILTERSNLLISRREEASRRQELEDKTEYRKVSTNTRSGLSFANKGQGGPLSRLISFLGFTTAGWIIENLPTWMFMGEEFISRIKSFGSSMYNMIGNMNYTMNLFGETLQNSLNAIIRLDFNSFSGEGNVTKTFEEFNNSIQDLGDKLSDTFKLFTTPLTQSLTTGELAPELDEVRPDSLYTPSSGGPTTSGIGTKEQQALLKTIRYAEGTAGPTGYSMFFGDRYGQAKYGDITKLTANEVEGLVTKFLNDPQSRSYVGQSAAVGAYQIINITQKARSLGMNMNRKFDQSFQDEMAIKLAESRGVTAEVLRREGMSDRVIKLLSPEWAPFPGNNYNQPTKKIQDLKSEYQKYLNQVNTSNSQRQPTGISGYKVTNDGRNITNYKQLPPHSNGTRTTYGGNRLKADFTLFKGGQFLNIPVPSPVDGTVNFAGYAGNGGNWVEIQSQRGLVELGHFNSLKVRQGDKVSIGTILGLQGHSGRTVPSGVEGTHVHIQASDDVIKDYISLLVSGRMPSGAIEQQAQITPQPRTPVSEEIRSERKGPQIVVIDDTPPPLSPPPQLSYPVSQVQSSPSMIHESKVLNNFIKNKLLLDLVYV